MSLWTATPVEASRELSVYHDISHVREALAARQLLRWSGGLMFAIVGGQLPGEFVADMDGTGFGFQVVTARKASEEHLLVSRRIRSPQAMRTLFTDGIMRATA